MTSKEKDKEIERLNKKIDMMEEWLYDEGEQERKEKMKKRLKKILNWIIDFFYNREVKDEISTD